MYLNGVEILRKNMPSGSIVRATLASSMPSVTDGAAYQLVTATAPLLVNGPNLIAVQTHLASSSSNRLILDVQFSVTEPPPTPSATAAALTVSSTVFKVVLRSRTQELGWRAWPTLCTQQGNSLCKLPACVPVC